MTSYEFGRKQSSSGYPLNDRRSSKVSPGSRRHRSANRAAGRRRAREVDYGWGRDDPVGWSYRTGESTNPRIGWSLVIAAICQGIIAAVAIEAGATAIGVLATAAIGACGALIVLAEIIRRQWP